MKTLMIYLAITWQVFAAPLPPYSITLNKSSIEAIPIHHEIDTLLIFPEAVESIIGKGLTSGKETKGSVLYKQGKENPKTIILRHLNNSSKLLMTIMFNNEAFVFRLEPSLTPASVVYLQKSDSAQVKPRKVTKEEALIKARPVSGERKLELFRLSKNSRDLRPKIPQLYEGYSEKDIFLNVRFGQYETSINRVAKFEKEDALLLFGHIKNKGNTPLNLGEYTAKLRVGRYKFCIPTKLRTEKKIIAPHGSVKFEALLIGDGNHSRLHLSLDNPFALYLNKKR